MVTTTTASGFLRELADMFEVVPGLPEPFTITAQASVRDAVLTEAQRFARVHDVAELLRVPVWTDWRGGRRARYAVGQFTYLVYEGPDRPVDRAPLGSREREDSWIVTRSQDRALASADPQLLSALAYDRGRQDAEQLAAHLAGPLRSRGLVLAPTALIPITDGEDSRV